MQTDSQNIDTGICKIVWKQFLKLFLVIESIKNIKTSHTLAKENFKYILAQFSQEFVKVYVSCI